MGVGASSPPEHVVHNAIPQSTDLCVIVKGDELRTSDWSAQLGKVMTREDFNSKVQLYMETKNAYDHEEETRYNRNSCFLALLALLLAIPTLCISCCLCTKRLGADAPTKVQAQERAYQLLTTYGNDKTSWKLEKETLNRKYIRIDILPDEAH